MPSPNKITANNHAATKTARKKKNLLARLFITLLFTLFLLLIAAPAAIKTGLQQWLSEQTQSDVTIAEVKLNIFSGKLFLRQLHIPHQNRAAQASSLEYASITVDMKALFRQQIVVNQITLSHADITIDQTSDQLRIAGMPVPQTADSAAEATPTTTSTGNPPAVKIHAITLESIALYYQSDAINSKVVINSKIKNINTAAPDAAVHMTLNLAIDRGGIRYQGKLQPFTTTPTFDGELTVDKLNLAAFTSLMPQSDFIINQLTLNHQSHINGALPNNEPPQFYLKGNTTLNNVDVMTTLNNDTYLKTTSIAINNIDVQYPTTVSIGEIIISDLDTALLKDNEGNLLTKAKPADTEPTTVSSKTVQKEQDPALVFSIDNLSIRGDSALSFGDASVSPQFNIKLQPLSLTLGRIDTANPTAKTTLSLDANINETGSTKLTGQLSPLADELNITLNNSLTALELPILSPYTEQHIGYQLRRGRLSAETALEIKGEQLHVTNKLTLAKLSIKESDPEKAQGLIEQLEMPLDSALDLLRDGNDNIVFDLPVNGSLNDPQFKLGGVVKLAIGKGMKMAAMNYLTNALQPLGTILLAKNIVGIIAKPRFKPLSFEAGRSELNNDSAAYLNKLGELLLNRPKLAISLCGIANQDDLLVLSTMPAPEQKETVEATPPAPIKEQLHALASARAGNARAHLSQQGIGNSQLFACNPEISPENGDSETVVEGLDITL